MSDFANLNEPVNDSKPASVENAFAWGADEIGRVIGRNGRQTHHLLTTGELRRSAAVGSPMFAHCFANSAPRVELCIHDV